LKNEYSNNDIIKYIKVVRENNIANNIPEISGISSIMINNYLNLLEW